MIGTACRRRAAAISTTYGLVLALLSPLHDLFSEWGGVMQYFAGREIMAGRGYQGWTSHFWPPLFPILMGLGSLIVPGFLAGKLISVVSSSGLLYVAYRLALDVSNSHSVALRTQLFLALSPWYAYESLRAHNHMIDALFFVWGLWFFVRSLDRPTGPRMVLSGMLGGLAGLSRYTSYVLLLLPLFAFALAPRLQPGRTLRMGMLFWAGFGLVSMPWWSYNALTNGSPVYWWHHLNVCSSVLTSRPHTMAALWWCVDQPLAGTADIVTRHPLGYLENVVRNLQQAGMLFVKWAGVLAPFVIPGLFHSVLHMPGRWTIVLFGMAGAYGLLLSQSHVLYWNLLPTAVVAVVVGVLFMRHFEQQLGHRWAVFREYRLDAVGLTLLLVGGALLSGVALAKYARERSSHQPLADEEEITRALREHDSTIQRKTIMAIDPARAYYAEAGYLESPPSYRGSVAEMVAYVGLSEATRRYAPKYPSGLTGDALKADYVVYTAPPWVWGMEEIGEFSFLLDPESDRIPPNFIPVYRSPRAVVYEIRR